MIFSVFKGMVMDGKDGKSYLADGHFAQLEGIKEESTLLLRNFYKSEEIFLDMFEDEYRVITLKSIQSSMYVFYTCRICIFNIFSFLKVATRPVPKVELVLSDASLLLPPTVTPLTGTVVIT